MQINKGDKIKINVLHEKQLAKSVYAVNPYEVEGEVLNANYSEEGWHIELEDEHGRHRYWNQDRAGGAVKKVS